MSKSTKKPSSKPVDYDAMDGAERAYALFTACEEAWMKGGHAAALDVWNAWAGPLVEEREQLIAEGALEATKPYVQKFGPADKISENQKSKDFLRRSGLNAQIFVFITNPLDVPDIEDGEEKIGGAKRKSGKTIYCQEINLDSFKFPGDLSFNNVRFKGEVFLSNAVFMGNIEFRGARFQHNANFEGAIFKAEVCFQNSTINGYMTIDNATIMGDVDLRGARVVGPLISKNATFMRTANFAGAAFKDYVCFDNTKFKGDIYFLGTTIKGGASFSSATFMHSVAFLGVAFKGGASFNGTAFKDNARFNDAVFKGNAVFDSAIFKDEATFLRVRFLGNVSFNDAAFKDNAHFNDATFKGNAVFDSATFKDEATFVQVIFASSVSVLNVRFYSDIDFSALHCERAFDLSGARFFNKVPRFIQAHFSESPRLDHILLPVPGYISGRLPSPNGVQRGWQVDQNDIAAYTALRRISLSSQDHSTERRAFKGEMRTKRSLSGFSFYRLFSYIYDALTDFGASIGRPLVVLFGLFAVVAFLYFQSAFPYQEISEYERPEICQTSSNIVSVSLLSAHNALPFVTTGQRRFIDRAYICLYGNGVNITSAKSLTLPTNLGLWGALHTAVSTILVFFILLGMRNRFRIR